VRYEKTILAILLLVIIALCIHDELQTRAICESKGFESTSLLNDCCISTNTVYNPVLGRNATCYMWVDEWSNKTEWCSVLDGWDFSSTFRRKLDYWKEMDEDERAYRIKMRDKIE